MTSLSSDFTLQAGCKSLVSFLKKNFIKHFCKKKLSKPCPTVTSHCAVSDDYSIMKNDHSARNSIWNLHIPPPYRKIRFLNFKQHEGSLTDWAHHILLGKQNHCPTPCSFLVVCTHPLLACCYKMNKLLMEEKWTCRKILFFGFCNRLKYLFNNDNGKYICHSVSRWISCWCINDKIRYILCEIW